MPRMIELIRAKAVPAALMRSAARGALSLPPWERIEILLQLSAADSNLREEARQTLDALDSKDAEAAFTDPLATKEVLQYLASRGSLVSEALPTLLLNQKTSEQSLVWVATAASRENVDILLASIRVCESQELLNALSNNPNLSGIQSATVTNQIEELLTRPDPASEPASVGKNAAEAREEISELAASGAENSASENMASMEAAQAEAPASDASALDFSSDPEVAAFFKEHEKELATLEEKEFQPIGGIFEGEIVTAKAMAMAATASSSGVSTTASQSVTPASTKENQEQKVIIKKSHLNVEEERGSALQKIAKLDVKGRIQLAMKGNKEERSILVRDGTKLVALAVLDSPKITDGEVEKFASQRNVQEAVLRGIPMKRRFAKNYIVVRNLVSNPRMPIDLSLGLMKNLLAADLKNLASNKEVSETVRKLALKMFKQKTDSSHKHS
jgi:hypothetical protein